MTADDWRPWPRPEDDPMGRRALSHHADRLRASLARANRSRDPIVRTDAPGLAGAAVTALVEATAAVDALLDEAQGRARRIRDAQRTQSTRSPVTRRH